MTNSTHPTQNLLLEYTSGRLPTAAGLTVSAHLETCGQCVRAAREMTDQVANLMVDLADSPLLAGTLDQVLARLDESVQEAPEPYWAARARPDHFLPDSLVAVGLKTRRPFGRGYWLAHTKASTAHGWRSFVLSIPPGGEIASHRHVGDEYVAVLEGELSDGDASYAPGDFLRSADQSMHTLTVSQAGRCTCLIAIQAPPIWQSPASAIARFWTGI